MYPSYSPLFTLGLLADASSRSTPASPVENDDRSTIYFTLKTRRSDTVDRRSFLYLDLADHKRRVPSHTRRLSHLSKSTSWTCAVEHDPARTEKQMIMSTPVVPARRRTSKESLRNIPCAKPAPSATLPELPTAPHLRPMQLSSFKKRSASTVVSLPLSPTPRLRRPASLRSESISSEDLGRSRMDALACLEGRSRGFNRIPRSSSLRNNFMSFSDDEDERSTRKSPSSASSTTLVQVEDLSAFADVEDEVDAVIPTLARKREAVDHTKPARPAKPARKRRGTIDSWFPLKSFIDLKDDDLSSWNWRSFIEIGGVS